MPLDPKFDGELSASDQDEMADGSVRELDFGDVKDEEEDTANVLYNKSEMAP